MSLVSIKIGDYFKTVGIVSNRKPLGENDESRGNINLSSYDLSQYLDRWLFFLEHLVLFSLLKP